MQSPHTDWRERDSDAQSLLSRHALTEDSRLPLFMDSSGERDITGALHLVTDESMQRLIDTQGAVRLLRQFAEDLARRDVEISELRRHTEKRERVLKAMLLEAGVGRPEVERRLLGIADESDRDQTERIRHETLDDSLQQAIQDTCPEPRAMSEPRTTTSTLQRKSSLAKWSMGLFGGRARRSAPVTRPQSMRKASTQSAKGVAVAQRIVTGQRGYDYSKDMPGELEGKLKLELYPRRRPPPHFLALVRSREIPDADLRTLWAKKRIASMAEDLITSGIVCLEEPRKEVNEDPQLAYPEPSRQPARDSRGWSLRETAQSVLPSAIVMSDESEDDGPVEMNTFVPEIERPPTMFPAWNSNGALRTHQVLTDRFGFKLSDVRQRQRELSGMFPPREHSSASEDDTSATRTATPASPPLSIDNGKRALPLASVANVRPLTPETSFGQTSATFDHDEGSQARLLMLSQLDLYGSDKAKSEAWDTFLRKCRKDRRRESRIAANIDDQLIGLAGLANSKHGRERRRELSRLVLNGIPIAYRPQIWGECTGAYLLKEPSYYEDLLRHGQDLDPVCVQQIDMDVHRTMPSNVFFAGTGPGTIKLRRVLLALSRHNREIGYCQGINNLAATLLLTHPTEEDAFFVLVSIVEKILPERYFTPDLLTSRADQQILASLVRQVLPRLFTHLDEVVGVELQAVTFGWFLSVFTECLPAEHLFRCWDVLFLEGHAYLMAIALAILKTEERGLLALESPAQVYTALKELARVRELHVDEFISTTAHMHHLLTRSHKVNLEQRQADIVKELLDPGPSSLSAGNMK